MIMSYRDTHDFVSYSVEAEVRYLRAMGLEDKDILSIRWIDLYLEYRMLLNHNHKILAGQHLNGKWTLTKPIKPSTSYAAACFRLLNKKIDTEHKEAMRQLIISAPAEYTPQQQRDIQEYCSSDVENLPALLATIVNQYTKKLPPKEMKTLREEILLRGEYGARTAIMVDTGYPINVEATKNFSENAGLVLNSCIVDINEQFPSIKPFRYERGNYVMNTKNIKEWIKSQKFPQWQLTDGGKKGNRDISLALEAWTDYFDFKHNYPRGNFGAQMVRYLKLKQSLNGFMPKKEGSSSEKKNFWDSVGNDGRVRPYFGIYGAQSGRSQPAATSFIPLKAAWMRSLIQPQAGSAIAGIDYGSMEFLLAALASNDKAMLDAYESGDVYLAFAKRIRLVPPTATKQTHKFERDLCKSTVLGLSYLMSKVGLAIKLTQDTGKEHTEDDAQRLIDLFDEAYPDYAAYREEIVSRYHTHGYLKIPCGWTMFGDNPNFRSVANFGIQGWGSSIMRKAVALAQDAGLSVIFTLHDALYIEYKSGDYGAIDTLAKAMDDAFRFYVPDELKSRANVKLDLETWSPDYSPMVLKTPEGRQLKQETIHVDERSVDEYKFFSNYFTRARSADQEML